MKKEKANPNKVLAYMMPPEAGGTDMTTPQAKSTNPEKPERPAKPPQVKPPKSAKPPKPSKKC